MKCLAAPLCALVLLPAAARAACLVCGPDGTEGCPGLEAHSCLSLHFGMAERAEDGISPHYTGARLGFWHSGLPEDDVLRFVTDERCSLTGLSVEALADLNAGALTGASLTLGFSDWAEVTGWQLAGLMSHADSVTGAQTALLMNDAAGEATGFQLGLVNRAGILKGVQIGLLNINDSGLTLPLINIGF